MSANSEKGIRKKLTRKVDSGDINSTDQYKSCLRLSIKAHPELQWSDEMEGDVHVSELRDLLLTMVTNKPITKGSSMNKIGKLFKVIREVNHHDQ